MIEQASPLLPIRDAFTTRRLASLFLFSLADGSSRSFTDHDVPLEFAGVTYTPEGSLIPSARRFQDGLRPASFQVEGPVTSGGVDYLDLRAGLYRDAQVIEAVVDWRYPFAGTYATHYWWCDQTTYDEERFQIELSGPSRFLRRPAGGVISRNCERTLGDSFCGVNLASFTASGAVAAGTDDGDKRLVLVATTASLGAFTDEYFTGGTLTGVAGANAGFTREIRSYRSSDRRVSLQVPMPYDIEAGDTFDLVAGCDKTYSTCVSKFSNGVNCAAFRLLPGSDRILQTPRTR